MSNYNNNNRRGGRNSVAAQSKNPHTDNPVPASRTLFIRNVQFDTTKSIVIEKLEPFGDIKDSFDLIAKRGLIFVTFYDLRSSENAMAALQELEFNGRKADIHYSIPKEGDKPEKSQASILVDCTETLLTHSLFEHMAKFGEIRSIRDHAPDTSKKIVAYWDSRACVRALEGIAENDSFGVNGKLNAIMFWDEGQERFADKVNSSSSQGDRDRRSGGRNRDRSLSPRRDQQDDRRRNDRGGKDNNRRDNNDRYNSNRNDDRRRSDRDSGRNDYYSSNNSQNQQQQPALNLMDILSQSKAAMQPPIINPGYGYVPQQMSFPGQPQVPAQNAVSTNLLATLLQSQAGGGVQANQVQQLMTLLTQMAPQQQQQQQQQQGFSGQNQNIHFPNIPQMPSSIPSSNDPRLQQQQQQQQPQQFRGYSSNPQPSYGNSQQYSSQQTLQQQQQSIFPPQMSYGIPASSQDPRLNQTASVQKPLVSSDAGATSPTNMQSNQSSNLQNLAALLMQTQKK